MVMGGATLLGAVGKAHAADKVLAGAGSSFAASVMTDWIAAAKSGLDWDIEYLAKGSGDGRNKVIAGDVDFALSDEPMTAEALKQAQLTQIPVLFGGIVPVVNLPGIADERLTLTAALLGGIYAGKIKTWNDPGIAAANPGVTLPNIEIRPVSQGTPNGPLSGTTFTFTQYLLLNNDDWRARHGDKITKRWAVGSMVATAGDMVETMKVLTGSVGYLSIGYARSRNLTTVKLRNRSGQVVAANVQALRGCTSQIDWTKAEALMPNLLDAPGDTSWPITASTYALIPVASQRRANAEAVREFFSFVVTKGEEAANRMHASSLPPAARELALHALRHHAS